MIKMPADTSAVSPVISIVTIVFNGEKYLEQTIRSVLDQNYRHIQYIIIDGGSTDQSLNIIKKYEKDIYYWISEKDRGIGDAFNKGIAKATGDIIGIIKHYGAAAIFVGPAVGHMKFIPGTGRTFFYVQLMIRAKHRHP